MNTTLSPAGCAALAAAIEAHFAEHGSDAPTRPDAEQLELLYEAIGGMADGIVIGSVSITLGALVISVPA